MSKYFIGALLFCGVAIAAPLVIPATDPELQFIGRFADSGSDKLFDMPGCEIRARIKLTAAAKVTITLAQEDSPVPPKPQGNTKNSHFQENAFAVFIDGVRQGADAQHTGGFNATFTTIKKKSHSYIKHEKSDCSGRDVKPQPSCGGNRNLSVAVLEACCDSTNGCSGFNTHGVIKNTDCGTHIGSQPTTDLYVMQRSHDSNEPSDYNLTTGGVPLAAGEHDIRVLKATEAQWNGGSPTPNYVTFSGFKIDAESAASELFARTIAPPPLPTRKIEFLGDSITAGYCNECKVGGLPNDHNEAFGATWDFQIGTILNAQVHTAAWSGLGMVHNCCGGNTTMPAIFSRTLATKNVDNTWDWSSWKPDALVVNLGTNDGGAATDPKAHYPETYSELVMQAASHYGAGLNVFLACGPMSTHYCDPIMAVIKNVTARGVKAHFLDQRGFLNGTFGPACCGHPSIEVDTAMAKSGAAFIKTTLGW